MSHRYLIVFCISLLILSSVSVPVRSYEVSDPGFTNDIIDKIKTPRIDPGDDGSLRIKMRNPYPDLMENITFTAEIYFYSYLDVEKNISEVRDPPVFDDEGVISVKELNELSTNETQELKYKIDTTEDTEEGVYSMRFELIFWMNDEKHLMRSRGFFSNEEWSGAQEDEGDTYPESLNVSGILFETTLEVKEPVPRWPQYLLGIVSGAAGILAVMFYMQEKYGYFPKLEETLDDWSSKLQEFRSRFK